MHLLARGVACLVASPQFAAVALLAFAGDSHGAARSLAIVTAMPLLVMTVPALYLAFRAHRPWLAVVSTLVSIVTA